ncbi:DUF2933 domain-containing protein [Selenihalanaerobacter shriftii]|uniref:DUF2933 domain-containing protein n=1 Tax=Selenihalanaerobacter shriftii TaxID=142842 RepID=A0A1T4NIA2_9FIRM|nr:DUF2933 domain-containing protein [Selenihalanaerobacter shriftii]SJZ78498.1 Protein of unknown function [Selenihalanaerobacter shriftii]
MSKKKNSNHNSHILMMLICCLAMFAAVWIFFKDSNIDNIWLLFLICPLMHIFMMRGHHNHNENKGEDEEKQNSH